MCIRDRSDSPPDRDLQWTEKGIASSYKFINKIWDLLDKFYSYKINTETKIDILDSFKILINDVARNIENFQFNKSVAKIYEYVNLLNENVTNKSFGRDDFQWSLKNLSIILQPFIPHISEEIWTSIESESLCIEQSWPVEKVVKKILKFNIAIQINGKTRSVIEISSGEDKQNIILMAREDKRVKKRLTDKSIIKEIYVPN